MTKEPLDFQSWAASLGRTLYSPGSFAEHAWDAAMRICWRIMYERRDTSGNYVANKEINPTKVTFANGRVVRIKKGALIVEWAKKKEPVK